VNSIYDVKKNSGKTEKTEKTEKTRKKEKKKKKGVFSLYKLKCIFAEIYLKQTCPPIAAKSQQFWWQRWRRWRRRR
jgi:hypothetical protein